MRMLFALAEIPHHRFGFYLHTVTSHLDMLNGQLLDTKSSNRMPGKQRYLGLSRNMEGKDKIKTIGKIKRSFLEVFDFGFKRVKQDDDTGN